MTYFNLSLRPFTGELYFNCIWGKCPQSRRLGTQKKFQKWKCMQKNKTKVRFRQKQGCQVYVPVWPNEGFNIMLAVVKCYINAFFVWNSNSREKWSTYIDTYIFMIIFIVYACVCYSRFKLDEWVQVPVCIMYVIILFTTDSPYLQAYWHFMYD